MAAVLAPAPSSSAFRSVGVRPFTFRVLVLLVAVLGTSCTTEPAVLTPTSGEQAVVSYVIDGDTVTLDFGSDVGEERARLIGIDTPESVSESVPDQCFGKEASEATRGLLPPGTEVWVLRDEEARDRYGRLLVYLYRVEDDLFVNRWLVENGFADVLIFEPNTTVEREFTALASKARADKTGLWGSCEGPDQPLVSGG